MFPNTLWPETITHETVEFRDIVKAGVNVWDFDYPSYYEGTQKAAFEQKVLDHFWTRQIGQETVGRFLLYFRRTVREIMPYYIQRYESVDLMKASDIRPLDNYNMVEEFSSESSETNTGKVGSEGSETGSSETGGATVHSETPQNTLALGLDTEGSVNLSHASDVDETRGLAKTANTSSSSTETESTGSGSETHRLTRRGNIGVTTYAQLLEGYRETFLNIDMEVIKELETCFLGVF